MTTELDLLAFGPHPDDVELWCGGLLASLADRGHRVGIVDLSRSELSSNGTVEGRAREAEEAARVLGLAVRDNLGFPDAGIDEGSRSQLLRVVGALRRLRPEVVLAPWRQARHPDHEATSRLVEKAVFYANVRKLESEPPGEQHAVRQLLYYPMRYQVRPSFVVDVSAVAERKRAAIACYASQLAPGEGGTPTLIGSPLTASVLEARDRYYGAMIGAERGEPYVTHAAISLPDPLDHFRRHPTAAPHLFERKP